MHRDTEKPLELPSTLNLSSANLTTINHSKQNNPQQTAYLTNVLGLNSCNGSSLYLSCNCVIWAKPHLCPGSSINKPLRGRTFVIFPHTTPFFFTSLVISPSKEIHKKIRCFGKIFQCWKNFPFIKAFLVSLDETSRLAGAQSEWERHRYWAWFD